MGDFFSDRSLVVSSPIKVEKWDRRFLNVALEIGSWSKDLSTKVGCILVKDRRIIGTGYNGAPRLIDEGCSERNSRPEKYYWFEHGERNAIYNCAREGVSTQGATAYVVPLLCCSDCARALVQSGIIRVVIGFTESGYSRIVGASDCVTFDRGILILKEAGIELELVWL